MDPNSSQQVRLCEQLWVNREGECTREKGLIGELTFLPHGLIIIIVRKPFKCLKIDRYPKYVSILFPAVLKNI